MPNSNVPAFKVVTWNVGGAKFLELSETPTDESPYTRGKFQRNLQEALGGLLRDLQPDVVLLQEIVRFGTPNRPNDRPNELIEIDEINKPISEHNNQQVVDRKKEEYHYASCVAIDTVNQSHPQKWAKYYKNNNWPRDIYLAQGYGILWRQSLEHAAIWNFEDNAKKDSEIEKEIVRIETGLFTGSRDTEPRIAVVTHFIIPLQGEPQDIFTINLHLTTLKGEREGSPDKDIAASKIRQQQLEIIANGVVSRYNEWVAEKRKEKKRKPAIWVIGGDFNCMPSAPEIKFLERINFIDLNQAKGAGTKGNTFPIKEATITLDYLFAGPAYHSIDPYLAMQATQKSSTPLIHYLVSDHLPVLAHVPIPVS